MFFGYLVSVAIVTKTEIEVDDEGIEVESGPLPFPFLDNVKLDMSEVVRVFYDKNN